jgi:signal transduction histidine kinase
MNDELVSDQVDILLVDDQPAGLLSLEATLGPLGQRLHRAASGREALRKLLDRDFALILLDVLMPRMDGFETARLIRERERSARTPIIFLTALSDGALPRLRAYSMGAVDFLVKPFEPEVLRSKVSVFVELARKTETIRRQARQLHDAQLKHHERELNRTREEFLAVALHELRTPLTSLSIQMNGLKRWASRAKEPLAPDALLSRIGELEGGLTRLNKLSDHLLDISRMREGRLALDRQRVDLGEVVHAVVAQQPAVPVSVEVKGAVMGFWDKRRMEQIAFNLINNAVRYGGGKPVQVTLSGDDERDSVTLRVRDEGIGISEEDQAQLFHRFFRGAAGADAQGFGLGLWIVQQLVTLHYGTVSMESQLGVGSTFTVTVPRRLEAAPREAGPEATLAEEKKNCELPGPMRHAPTRTDPEELTVGTSVPEIPEGTPLHS